jgi:GNAT superfamily N-acetyltransferase
MISVREASPAEAESWLHDWRGRLHAWYARADVSEEWTRHHVERRVSNHVESLRPSLFVLSSEGTDVGFLAAAQSDKDGPPTTLVTDVWIDPAHRRRGHAAAALRWAQPWAAHHGKRFVMVTDPSDPAQDALCAGFPVRAHNMIKRASEVTDLGTDLSGHPMTEVEYGPWRAISAQGYADDIASSGLMTREEAAERAETQLDEFIPQGLHPPITHSGSCARVRTRWPICGSATISNRRRPGSAASTCTRHIGAKATAGP